jgi:hypothetical protein
VSLISWIERLADLIEGVGGEFSPFEELHGFSIANTAAPDGEPQFTGWCFAKDDL